MSSRNRPRIHHVTDGFDSESLLPPLELQTLVMAGCLPGNPARVLEIGCGIAVESVYLACAGWERVCAIDSEEDQVRRAYENVRRHRVDVKVAQANVLRGQSDLPPHWPKTYELVLDRLCINNVVHSLTEGGANEEDARATYFANVATLVAPGGLLVLRDRWYADQDQRFRRSMFELLEPESVLRGAHPYFELVKGTRPASVRLIGDDTPDFRRLDAMVPIPGMLALLKRTRRKR